MSLCLHLESPASAQDVTRFVEQMSGQVLRECYQCAKCAAGCPLGRAVDLSPQQLVRALQLGQADVALDSKALWLCVGCQTCATRCPCEVDVPRVMDALRAWALASGRTAAEREVTTFHRVFLKTVEMMGRVYEVGLIGGYNLLSGHLFDSLDLGWPMVRRGKIRPFPARVRARAEVAAIFERAERVRARERNAAQEAARGATP
jgi:heterodisulfide reductase subunit C2